MLNPVENLSATYIPENNTLSVIWTDENNTFLPDGNFTYLVSYNISVAGVLLFNESIVVTPTNVSINSTVFSLTISERHFLQASVRVDILVSVNTVTDQSSFVSSSVQIPGGKEEV